MRKNILLSIVVLICLVTVFAVGCVGDCGCNLGGFNLSSCNLPRCSHYWGEGEVTLEAKCDADGVTTYTCSKCGEKKEEAITERPAHVWDSGVETKPATEAENGIKTYNCTVCGETKTEEIPKLGHTHSYSQTWSNNDTYHWHECGCGDKINYGAHNESGWITDKEPTCAEYGIKHKECTVCGKKITTTSIEKQEHEWETLYTHDSTQHWKKCKDCPATTTKTAHFYENGVCVCGKNEPAYVRNGKTIYFGSYPQTEVKDTALISTLNTLTGTLPTSSNSQDWTSYGYYISSSVQDYMWYIDVTYGGEKYRGVYFRTYRPMSVLYESTDYYTMQEVNGYYPYHVYWFKYEPISWTILDESKGLILCDLIIDSQEYYSGNTREIDGQTIYRNNYEYSNIRAWLNDDFYNTVFSLKEQNIIKITEVDNGERSVKNNNEEYWYGIQNTYFSNNTFDKVFLLSYQEVTNESYGFDSWYGQNGKRAKESTEYAKSQGVAWSGDWWLRSPSYDQDDHVYDVEDTGYIGSFNYVYYTDGGVVPALCIEL